MQGSGLVCSSGKVDMLKTDVNQRTDIASIRIRNSARESILVFS